MKVMDSMSKNLIERVEIEQRKEEKQHDKVKAWMKKVDIVDDYFIQKTLA